MATLLKKKAATRPICPYNDDNAIDKHSILQEVSSCLGCILTHAADKWPGLVETVLTQGHNFLM